MSFYGIFTQNTVNYRKKDAYKPSSALLIARKRKKRASFALTKFHT